MNSIKFKGKKVDLNKISSVVVDLPHGLGDQIMCYPLFASLKRAYPHLKISVLTTNAAATSLLKHNPNIQAVNVFSLKFTYSGMLKFFLKEYFRLRALLKRNSFDLHIVVHPNTFRSVLLKLLPFKNLLMNLEHAHKSKESANVLEYLKVPVVYDYSMKIADNLNFLSKKGLKEGGYILIDLYAQHLENDLRQWPHFNLLIEKLRKDGYQVVVVGINSSHIKIDDCIDLVNNTSFNELLELISGAKLVVSMDTGLFHLSYSLNSPLLGLFGPINPEDRAPFNSNLKVKTIYHALECSPCIKNRVEIDCTNLKNINLCMKGISVDEVYKEIKNIL